MADKETPKSRRALTGGATPIPRVNVKAEEKGLTPKPKTPPPKKK